MYKMNERRSVGQFNTIRRRKWKKDLEVEEIKREFEKKDNLIGNVSNNTGDTAKTKEER